MILQEINYYEFDGQANSWSLKNLTIEKINLLVGKNATGKTRTMSVIARLGSMFLEVQPVAFGYDLTNIKCCQYPNLSTLGGQPMYLLNVTENDRQADLFMKKIAIFVE
ncbi:MAG: hypothetical protein LBU17_12580, partial [Treponema sp.]|nr:hypothetical protein [Treponema sp.]